MMFLAAADAVSACGMIITAVMISLYAFIIGRIRKKRILSVVLSTVVTLILSGDFVCWCIYTSHRFSDAGSFLRYCPFGISFFFLQAIRFVYDAAKGREAARAGFLSSLEYMLFYPVLVMGPAMSYREHMEMTEKISVRTDDLGEGLSIFTLGLSKKVILADSIGMIFSPLYDSLDSNASVLMAWLTVIAFALQLFFTLSGYGDMARGIALCYGFRIPESYRKPLLSGSLSKFGEEWNMSVSSFFREMFSPMLKNYRWQYIAGMFFAWTLQGIWYRPFPVIIIWGAWMGLWIGIDGCMKKKFRRIPTTVYAVMFFIALFFGFAFMSGETLSGGIRMLGLTVGTSAVVADSHDFYYIRSGGLVLAAALYAASGNFGWIMERIKKVPVLSSVISFAGVFVQAGLLLLCALLIVTGYDITLLQLKGVM